MPILPLVNRPIEVNVRDADAVRKWLMDRVRQEVTLVGAPHPKLLLLGRGYEETFDLDAMAKRDPGAHPGATFQALRSRPGIERRFVELLMTGEDTEGNERTFALLLEEIDAFDGMRWWMATLEFTTDPESGTGRPGDWVPSSGETSQPAHLPPFLRELSFPPPGSRSAAFAVPSDRWEPDVRFAFGEVPEGKPLPTNAREMVEFAAALALGDLLQGRLKGTLVVRLAGREWQQWVLEGDMPGGLEEMVRYIAHQDPVAEAVAILQFAIRPQDDPPVVGMQIIGELGGMFCETWSPVEFPEGPKGPKVIRSTQWWNPRPVPARGMWLGVEPTIEFEHRMPES